MKKIFVLSLLLIVGCAPKPEPGPAEQIGKGIDQITKGMTGIDRPADESDYARRRRLEREELARARQRDPYYDDYRRDDYYDSRRNDDFYSGRSPERVGDADRPAAKDEGRY